MFFYKYEFISYAFAYFYGVGFGLPIVIFILIKYLFGVDFKLINSICVYGYSFTILIPLLFICIAPYNIVEYIALGYGLLSSTVFLVYNIYKLIEDQAKSSKYIILALIVGFQVILYFVLKFYFFTKITKEDYDNHMKTMRV